MFLSDPPPFLKTFGLLMLQGDQKQKLGRNGLTSVFCFFGPDKISFDFTTTQKSNK